MIVDRRVFVVGAAAASLTGCVTSKRPKFAMEPPALWGPLTPGPYCPGLSIDWIGSGGRRIQRWTWFPARHGSGRPLTVGDLGALYVSGGPPEWPSDPRAIYATGYDEPGDVEKFAKLLALTIASRVDAVDAVSSVPLVVLGQGFAFESPFHQIVLAEYLASWGYRVVTAPLIGATGFKADVSPATLARQVDDLAVLAQRSPRGGGLALVGYDLGGMAAVALAASGRVRPDLVIGIDSGVILEKLAVELLESRPDFGWDRLAMPYVHITRSAAENSARKLDESLRIFETGGGAPRAMIRIPQMRHADFGTIGALESVYPNGFGTVQGKPALGHATMVFLVRDALDHFLRRARPTQWRPQLRGSVTIERWPR